jgi:hypothetical protein
MKKLLLSLMMLLLGSTAYAQDATNYGFENGNYTDWVVSNGSTAVKTGGWSSNGSGAQVTTGVNNYCPGGGKCWTIAPSGVYMLAIQAGGGSPVFNTAMTSLGLSSAHITEIRSYLTGLGGNSSPTNASWVKRDVTLQAGMTYTFAWQYLSTDYMPFNDGSIITLTGAGVPTLNGEQKNYALLGFTNTGTGNYSVGSYGATGWQLAVFTVPVDGIYSLGFASFNLGDTSLSPILFIDQIQGTTSLNGQTFAPVQPNEGSSAPSTSPPPAEPTYPLATISSGQSFKLNQTTSITQNRIYLDSYGDFNTVNIEQFSRNNEIRGVNGSPAMLLNGSNNTVTINQGSAGTVIGQNLAEVSITGNGNTIALTQQQNKKYAEVVSSGNSNQLTLQQQGANEKSLFINVLGNSNIINTLQQGTGNHFLEINSPFGGLNANITQSGSANKQFQLILNSPNIGVTVNQTNSTLSDSAKMVITCTTGPCNGYSYTKN